MFADTVADAPAASAPTFAVPTLVVPRYRFTFVAPEAAVPALRTVADAVIASVSTGFCGDQDTPEIVRSGFGAGTPKTWNSAACPPPAPELAVTRRRTSAARPLNGIVTVFPDDGLKL